MVESETVSVVTGIAEGVALFSVPSDLGVSLGSSKSVTLGEVKLAIVVPPDSDICSVEPASVVWPLSVCDVVIVELRSVPYDFGISLAIGVSVAPDEVTPAKVVECDSIYFVIDCTVVESESISVVLVPAEGVRPRSVLAIVGISVVTAGSVILDGVNSATDGV